MAEYLEQAQALLAIQDGLGEFYQEQKDVFLDTILALPVKEAASVLNSFVGIGFLTREELSANVKKLFAKQAPAQPSPSPAPSQPSPSPSPSPAQPSPSPSVEPSPYVSPSPSAEISPAPAPAVPAPTVAQQPQAPAADDVWGGRQPGLDTSVASIKPQIARLAGVSEQDIASLIDSLSTLNVFTVGEVIQTQKNNEKHHFLDDLMPPHVYGLFKKGVIVLEQLPCVAAEKQSDAEKLRQIDQLRNAPVADVNAMFHLWNNAAQLLVLPVRNKYYFFCSVETPQTEATLAKGEHLVFCLDVSASMNHDDKRSYCAPKSPDHPASSIKKARELTPQLTLPALKRNASVTVIIWNYKIQNVIEFTPSMFMDAETGEFSLDDIQITNRIKIDTSESVFRARGGTNIEAAIQELGTKMRAVAVKVAQVSVWFLTDGEETVYLQPDGSCEHIPTNPNQTNFRYFNEENEEGITPYQKKMVKDLVTIRDDLLQSQCYLQFHACHFGEAHPLFLKTLAASVDGHFHTFVDVANIAREINASLVSATAQLAVIGYPGARPELFPASLSEGYMQSRGELSQETFESILAARQPKVRTVATGELLLDMRNVSDFPDDVRDCVAAIISLEADLENVLRDTAENVKMDKLRHSAQQLRDLRQRRLDAVTAIPRSVRSNAMLLAFLEKILESVEAQMESFTRLLEQYLKPEQGKYDQAMVNKNDMFTSREQLAISAGVESMRVQMGKGFVNRAYLDKYIQRLVAEQGPRALRMLERVCLVAETVKGDVTHLSLFIVEGRALKESRSRYTAQALAARNHPPSCSAKYSDTLRHNDENQVVVKVKILVHDNASPPKLLEQINEEVPFASVYPHIVESYHCAPTTDDLEEATRRLLDPLSYSHFLDLVRENNTLPAYLYTIGKTQSPGLFFNAKEMLYVKEGGSDSTSLDYFRLYWRLAKKDENNCVKVPGTFSAANFALPVAPEPFTNLVLSCLMPGLLSEFITGTPMAPLTGIVDLYIGFLLMHMRGKFTGLDITRIAELLSTMRCWVDNPHTIPKPETFRELIDQMVKDQGIAASNSPGKLMPLKAFAYALLDDQQPFHLKYSAIYNETLRRYVKQLLVANSELKKPAEGQPQARTQIGITDFFRDLVKNLDTEARVENDIPVSFLATAHRLSALVVQNKEEDVLGFLSEPRHTDLIAGALWQVLGETSRAAPHGLWWSTTQRMMSAWICFATYSCTKLKDTFSQFKAPSEFEAHASKMLTPLVKNREDHFQRTLFQWIEPSENAVPTIVTFEYSVDGKLQVRDAYNHCDVFACAPELQRKLLLKFWSYVHPILNLWYWKNRPSTAYGLQDLDFDIVQALRDHTRIATLSPLQVSELNNIKGYKDLKYIKFLAPKPVTPDLPQSANFSTAQNAKNITDKPRISCIFIGAPNCGKSTLTGHLVVKCGFVDQRVLQRCIDASTAAGRRGSQYAWLLNKLREERQRGVSIETVSWGMDTQRYEVDLLDAPGHHDFIKNMMTGASLADVALLVVDASPGNFEAGIARGGMTREESLVAYATGIRQFVVLVTKMDNVGYSKERFDEISENVLRFLRQLGITREIPVIPLSGLEGDNLIERSPKMPWFTGRPSNILEAIDSLEPPQRVFDVPARVPIVKTFKVGGVGTVAIGRVVCGVLKRGDVVTLQPSGIETEVASIEIYHTQRQVALPGDCIGFKLKNVTVRDVPRGLVACAKLTIPNAPTPVFPRITSFTAQIVILYHPTQIKQGYTPFVCVHTRTIPCRFAKFLEKNDRRTGAKLEDEPKQLKSGDAAHVVIEPVLPVYVEPITKCPALARFVVRDGTFTVAVGVIKSVEEAKNLPPSKVPVRAKHTLARAPAKPAAKKSGRR